MPIDPAAAHEAIARAFVRARVQGRALAQYPGALPASLHDAYLCQEYAIGLWPDVLAGWKVGRIAPELEQLHGQSRLSGPVFRGGLSEAQHCGAALEVAVFAGGFAAVEAEFVFRIGRNARADKLDWSAEEARDLVETLHIGIEIAGSPLATINDLGPQAIVSDFGNHAGLIVGSSIEGWTERRAEDLRAETSIEGQCVGRGNAAGLPGGPLESLRWLLGHSARRGRPLRRGQYVSSGATTGVHRIRPGQRARVVFADLGAIDCRAYEQPVRADPRRP